MRVEFWRDDEGRVSGWDVFLPHRRPVRGTVMALGRGLSCHDLDQYVIEAATNFRDGFWGLVSRGATFRSMGKAVTKPGRALIVRHRAAIAESERLAGERVMAWRLGERTPVTAALERASGQFQQLGVTERLAFTWPQAQGHIVSITSARGGARHVH